MERAANGTDFDAAPAARTRTRVLFVPGFVVDVYSEIERQYVELCARPDPGLEFVWLVPQISGPCNNFAKADSRATLQEPVWVQHLRSNGIRYEVASISRYNPVANFLLFRRLFRAHDIDAVYTHFGFERFWAVVFARLYGKTTLWNEHWHSLGTRHVAAKRLFYRLFVDHFIAVSRFIADTLPASGSVHVVRNAIDAGAVGRIGAHERRRVRERLRLPRDCVLVLLVSAFRENKRHDLALEICRRVLRERENVAFVFLGEGPLREAVTGRARRLGHDGRIFFPGHVDDIEPYYSAADLCMLTSIGEPCALAVFESMKHALPLVAFHSGGTPEIITHGESGVLVPERDVDRFAAELIDLIDDEGRRRVLGECALRAVRAESDRDAWITRLRALLRDLARPEQRGQGTRHADRG